MIKLAEVKIALHYLADSAEEYAQARGARVWAEERRKSIKAHLMNQSLLKNAVDREAEAYAHPDYLAHLDLLRESVTLETKLHAAREGQQAVIEVWRTLEASRRKEAIT